MLGGPSGKYFSRGMEGALFTQTFFPIDNKQGLICIGENKFQEWFNSELSTTLLDSISTPQFFSFYRKSQISFKVIMWYNPNMSHGLRTERKMKGMIAVFG
jgi:hypothetical protein